MPQAQAEINILLGALMALPVAVLLLLGFFGLGRIGQRMTVRALSRPRANPQAVQLVGNLVLLAGWVLGAVAALAALGVQLSAMATGLGLLALGLGLSLGDILRNLFAGVVLLLEQPFKLGDFLVIDDVRGTVEVVGLRTTQLRTPDNHLAIVPNSTVFNSNLTSLSAYPLRRVVARVSAGGGAADWVKRQPQLLERLRSFSDPAGPPPQVRLNVAGDPPVPIIEAEVWADSSKGATNPDQLRSDVLERILADA